jgi:hypothetical protein
VASRPTLADVLAGVSTTMATYTQALDDGRTDDLVATFCLDGSCDLPGLGQHEGHEALRAAYGRWAPKTPQRHLISNTLITEWSDDEAKVTSDVVFLHKGEKGWAIGIVGRYEDVLHFSDGSWRFHRRVATFPS